MERENRLIRALPLNASNLVGAFLNSPVIGPHLRIGKMISESTAEIPHIITRSSIEEGVHFSGEKPAEPGTRVVIYDAG
jgi:hypothetical protein